MTDEKESPGSKETGIINFYIQANRTRVSTKPIGDLHDILVRKGAIDVSGLLAGLGSTMHCYKEQFFFLTDPYNSGTGKFVIRALPESEKSISSLLEEIDAVFSVEKEKDAELADALHFRISEARDTLGEKCGIQKSREMEPYSELGKRVTAISDAIAFCEKMGRTKCDLKKLLSGIDETISIIDKMLSTETREKYVFLLEDERKGLEEKEKKVEEMVKQ